MRTCNYCGDSFGFYRHVFRRSEFCSEACAEAFQSENSRREAWEIQCQGDELRRSISSSTTESRGTLRQPVLLLQKGSDEPRLYFIGASLHEFSLAQSMGPGHAVYGVAPSWPVTWRDAATMPTMAQIAAAYAAAIAAHTSLISRIVLVGYSFSGTIAFEVARQLVKYGVNVELVILIDSRSKYPIPNMAIMSKKLKTLWSEPFERGLTRAYSVYCRLVESFAAIKWALARNGRDIFRSVTRAILRDPGPFSDIFDTTGARLRWGLLEKMIHFAGKSYQIKSAGCCGALICVDQKRERLARELDPSLGWGDLFSGGLKIVNVAGNHFTIMRQSSYRLQLAQTINDLVDASNTGAHHPYTSLYTEPEMQNVFENLTGKR